MSAYEWLQRHPWIKRIQANPWVQRLEHEHFILIGVAVIIALSYTSYALIASPGEPEIAMVSGTEYISGEEGQGIVRVTDTRGRPYDVSSCKISILYPDKTYFIIDAEMTESTVAGNYYKTFMTPVQIGIYEEHITCDYTDAALPGKLQISSSFHVSYALNYLRDMEEQHAQDLQTIITKIDGIETNIQANNRQLADLQSSVTGMDETLTSQEATLQETSSTVKTKFEKINTGLASLGQSLTGIFTEE